jgi:hypothetical protein
VKVRINEAREQHPPTCIDDLGGGANMRGDIRIGPNPFDPVTADGYRLCPGVRFVHGVNASVPDDHIGRRYRLVRAKRDQHEEQK